MEELLHKRIMIVEDNVVNLAVYAVAFKDSGAIVLQDPFTTNALHMLKAHMPLDIILLDLMLRRGISGYDVFEQIQADPDLSKIPVIAISAADPNIEIPKAKQKGFIGFIGKPIDPFRLVEQVAACIKGEHVWYSQEEQLRGF
jgi:CheY-like chemotaxis protein